MKMQKFSRSGRWMSRLAVAGSLLGCSTFVQAANMYWDPNGLNPGPGGTGTWDNGTTAAWANNSSGVANPVVWNNANNDSAEFRGTAGTVTTSGSIIASKIVFGVGGYTLQGDTITLKQPSSGNYDTVVTTGTFTGTTTIKNNIVLSPVAATGEVIARFANNTDSHTVYDGTIGFDLGTVTPGTGNKRLAFGQSGTGSITINGQIAAMQGTVGTAYQEMHFGAYSGSTSSGTYYVNSDNSTNVTGQALIAKGTVYASNAGALGSNTINLGYGNSSANGDSAKFLTVGGLTITRNISSNNITNAIPLEYLDTLHQEFGGSTAHESTFSGIVYINKTNLTVSSVAGGLVNVSGLIQGGDAAGLSNLIKDGNGIVKLSRAAGNSYGVTGTKATTVKAGTLIITNTSGSATGTSLVTVNADAAFGGTGTSTGLVTSQGAGSVFTPGDMGISGVSSIGTLNLTGGLTATSGATFKIDLNGAANDKINFGAAALTLGGTITFDFLSLGPVETATPYSLFVGTGAWSGTPSFVFNGPSGYELDSAYGGGEGYIWNAASRSLTVQFAAIPEPSVAGLVLLGGLACLGRRRSARV